MDSWLSEIYDPRARRVHLATGFDFHEKNRVCFVFGARLWRPPPTLPLYYEGNVKKTIPPPPPPRLRVRIKNRKNSPHGKFHRLLFSFASKFSDPNFASFVLYTYPCMSRVKHSEPGLPMFLQKVAFV